jgi:FAD/FMN-containing dehydrogenase
MQRFNHIHYDKEKKTLDVGAGVIWKDVYEYLEQFASDASDHAPGVVGGDPLVGVSGWLLGGGYSLLTNRFGLGMDNVIGFRVLLPGLKGVCKVSGDSEENPEIFKALKVRSPYHDMIRAYVCLTGKGGGHNFGIITQFTLQVHDRAKRVGFLYWYSRLSLIVVDTDRPHPIGKIP